MVDIVVYSELAFPIKYLYGHLLESGWKALEKLCIDRLVCSLCNINNYWKNESELRINWLDGTWRLLQVFHKTLPAWTICMVSFEPDEFSRWLNHRDMHNGKMEVVECGS